MAARFAMVVVAVVVVGRRGVIGEGPERVAIGVDGDRGFMGV